MLLQDEFLLHFEISYLSNFILRIQLFHLASLLVELLRLHLHADLHLLEVLLNFGLNLSHGLLNFFSALHPIVQYLRDYVRLLALGLKAALRGSL